MGEESNARCVDCTRFEQYAQMAEKERDDARDEVDWLRAKLTALRAAAERARELFTYHMPEQREAYRNLVAAIEASREHDAG